MDSDRRAFLTLSGSALAAFWLTADPAKVREALQHAHRMSEDPPAQASWKYLTPEQAADVEAIASQIMPSDDTPGAKEAGVVYFIDQSMSSQPKDEQAGFTRGLDSLNAEVAKRWPGTARFGQLPFDRQTELLKAQEKTEFFQNIRAATLMGFFGNPSYGGNRNKVGWELIQFEDRYAWQPPFGDYDRAAQAK